MLLAECSGLFLSEPCSFQCGLSQVREMPLKIGVEEYDKEGHKNLQKTLIANRTSDLG